MSISKQKRASAGFHSGASIIPAQTKGKGCSCGDCQKCIVDRKEVIDGRYAHLISGQLWLVGREPQKLRNEERDSLADRLARGEYVARKLL